MIDKINKTLFIPQNNKYWPKNVLIKPEQEIYTTIMLLTDIFRSVEIYLLIGKTLLQIIGYHKWRDPKRASHLEVSRLVVVI